MSNFGYNARQGNYNSNSKPNAFKIYHADNNNDTVIVASNDFCKAIHDALLSNYCENKALVAFAKQLVQSNYQQEPRWNKNHEVRQYRKNNISYGNDMANYQSRSHERMHPADVEDYLDDME